MYCENCHRLVEGDKCPVCRKKCKREVQEDDLCLVCSISQIWADMLSDVLQQNDIPYYKQSDIGAGMAMFTSLQLETFSIFVPFSHYEEAKGISDALFSQVQDENEDEESEQDDALSSEEED